MIPGTPAEARWVRSLPRLSLPLHELARIVETGFRSSRILHVQPLTEGLRNANFKIQLESPSQPIVARIYEHDTSLCRKELDLLRLLSPSIPVPRVLHAETAGLEGLPPFMLMQWVEGVTFHALKRQAGTDAIQQAARSVGETLAAIGRFRALNRDGSAQALRLPHLFWKDQIQLRALSIYALPHRTFSFVYPRNLENAPAPGCGQEKNA